MKNGIDVSEHQGNINWQGVANTDTEFVILRTGYGSTANTQIDKNFYTNLAGCQNVNLPVGAYHYGYATSVDEARQEAEFCLNILNGANMPYGIWYDVEEQCMFDCGAENLTDIVNAFCEIIENAGYKAGIYMSSYQAQNYVNMDDIPYYKWIAQYNDECTYQGHYDIWQYSSDKHIDGISENTVDTNYCYTDFEAQKTDRQHPLNWTWYDNCAKWAASENGNWIYDKWVKDNGKWYRIGADGWLLQCGWYNEGDYWYYLKPDNGEMFTGWLWDNLNQGWYYLDENGRLVQENWHWDDDTQGWYYLKADGKMAVKEYVNAPDEISRYWTNENGKWQK